MRVDAAPGTHFTIGSVRPQSEDTAALEIALLLPANPCGPTRTQQVEQNFIEQRQAQRVRFREPSECTSERRALDTDHLRLF